MPTSDQKGAIAESAIACAAIKLDIGVYKPLFEGGRYDLIFDVGSRLLRVQCKWAPRHGDVIVVRCRSCRRTRDGLRHRRYTAAEVDAIAVYCEDLDRCYLVSADQFDGRAEVTLRVAPTRNHQRAGIHWADDFALEARLRSLVGP